MKTKQKKLNVSDDEQNIRLILNTACEYEKSFIVFLSKYHKELGDPPFEIMTVIANYYGDLMRHYLFDKIYGDKVIKDGKYKRNNNERS